MKTVSPCLDPDSSGRVLDVGCGIGVLGLAVLSACHNKHLTGTDRDALALAVSGQNARNNATENTNFLGALGTGELDPDIWDLILANLPAKAGGSVLVSMISEINRCLHPTGLAAVVIVKPLERPVEQTILSEGGPLAQVERGPGHTVFHFKKSDSTRTETSVDPLQPYLRSESAYCLMGTDYVATTVHNLSEFDTVGFGTEVAASLAREICVEGDLLLWNPGQGHLATALNRKQGGRVSRWILGSRDLLSLEITKNNLIHSGVAKDAVEMIHRPYFNSLDFAADVVICFPDDDPGVDWPSSLPSEIDKTLPRGGYALVTARSTFIHRMAAFSGSFEPVRDRRRKGFRGVLMRKKTENHPICENNLLSS